VSLDVRYVDLAQADVVEAWAWHEDQQPGLGDRFLDAVKEAVDRARRWPNSGKPVVSDKGGEVVERKVATRGFTWAIRYRVGDTELVVMAVHHQRRHPEHGANRRP
jgi:toxin ParE1/3/4